MKTSPSMVMWFESLVYRLFTIRGGVYSMVSVLYLYRVSLLRLCTVHLNLSSMKFDTSRSLKKEVPSNLVELWPRR
jgi:hypothetical protein